MYEILGKKRFFQSFNIFFLFWEWFKCYFWIPHPKINKSTNFHKNSVNQTHNMNEKCTTISFQDGRQEDKREGLCSKLLIAISQKLFEIETWNLVLLFTFTVCAYAPNFIEIWEGGFQACPTLMWNFP